MALRTIGGDGKVTAVDVDPHMPATRCRVELRQKVKVGEAVSFVVTVPAEAAKHLKADREYFMEFVPVP